MNDTLELANITKFFGVSKACDNLSLTITKGEFFFILGPSGCGKSTLLQMIAGLLVPDEGEIRLNNVCLNTVPAYRRDINMVFQNYALFPHLDVFNNVAFGLKMKNVPKEEIKRQVTEMLGLVQLESFETRYPAQLSGGQQQRVALARALVNKPSVLLLDESLGALDVKLRKQMQIELKALQKKLDTTFIYVTHDQEEALTMGDRIALMNRSVFEQVGSPTQIYNHPESQFAAEFIGETNFFHSAQIHDHEAVVTLGEQKLRAPLSPSQKGTSGTLTLSIRPEKIKLSKTDENRRSENQIRGKIQNKVYRGSSCQYFIDVGQPSLMKVIEQNYESHASYQVGEEVFLHWPFEETIVLAR